MSSVDRAGCILTDFSAESFSFSSAKDYRCATNQDSSFIERDEEALTGHPTGTPHESRHKLQSRAQSAGKSIQSSYSSPKVPSRASPSKHSDSASATSSTDDSWNCGECGGLFANIGLKESQQAQETSSSPRHRPFVSPFQSIRRDSTRMTPNYCI